MEPLLERISRGEVVVSDGALGTMLIAGGGLQPGECPDGLVLERPELLRTIAVQYLEAGSEIIHTDTFGSSSLKLSDYGLEDRTEEINGKAVEILREAVGGSAYVSGSCGPTGRIMTPYGDTEPDEVSRAYERQMKALVSAGVDVICIETMIDLREAVLAVRAARSASADIPVMATMTFDRTPNGFYTVWGTGIEEAAAGLSEAGADIVGSNCGNGIGVMVEIAGRLREATPLPLLIQSNAGQPESRDGEVVYAETPELFAKKTRELIDIGVSVIGGCCGTTPDHIRAIRGVTG